MELLALPSDGVPRMLLDLGCGSCLSGDVLTESGHTWVGMDISQAMLDVAREREVEGDVCLHDLGQGLPLRPGCFDGAISISAIQWLCNADTATADPRKRLRHFFDSLYACLNRGARAVLQMYPENMAQAQMLTSAAMRAGFSGGLVVDFPHSTRAKKFFLVLMVGAPAEPMDLQGLDGEPGAEDRRGGVSVVSRQHGRGRKKKHGGGGGGSLSARHPEAKGKAWVHKKKEAMRAKGYLNVPADSKHTGRKRKSFRH